MLLRAFLRAAAISCAARTMQAPRVRWQALRLAVVQTCLQTEKACGGRLGLTAKLHKSCRCWHASAHVKQAQARRLCSKADSQRAAIQHPSIKSHQRLQQLPKSRFLSVARLQSFLSTMSPGCRGLITNTLYYTVLYYTALYHITLHTI